MNSLATLIQGTSEWSALVAVNDHTSLAALLNAKTQPGELRVTKRTLAAVLGVVKAATIMATLKSLAAGVAGDAPVYQLIFELLDDVGAGGIDISLPESKKFIDQFVAAKMLAQDDADAILALAANRQSLAEAALGRAVTPQDVQAALEAP